MWQDHGVSTFLEALAGLVRGVVWARGRSTQETCVCMCVCACLCVCACVHVCISLCASVRLCVCLHGNAWHTLHTGHTDKTNLQRCVHNLTQSHTKTRTHMDYIITPTTSPPFPPPHTTHPHTNQPHITHNSAASYSATHN